jgi:WD40 repeat protein
MTDDDDLQAIDESATPPSVSSTASLLDADGPLFQRNLLPEPSIIQFLCDRVKTNPGFEQQLCAVIHQSKVDAGAAMAAANAITILVRAGVHFNGADLQGVKISGADLSEGQFDSAQFQGADLRGVILSRSWLRQADLSNVQMEGVRLGESPYLELDSDLACCVYSPDGTMLAAGIGYWGLVVYSTATWTRVHQIGDTGSCYSIAFSPNSQQIVFGSGDKVRLLDCSSGKEVLVMKGHTKHVHSVAFSPCGMLLASAGMGGTVRLWNSQTGECRFVLEGHTQEISSVKFTPCGRQLLSGSMDGTIRYWDSMTGESDLVLESVLGGVCCLAYSHDGRWIVSGQDDGTIQVWDAVTRERGPVLRGHTDDVRGVAFSLDDQWIASSSRDETVRLWDSSTGVCVSTFIGHRSDVWDVAFSPDGTQLASGGEDHRVRLWDISSIGWSVDQQEHHVGHVDNVMYSSKALYLLSASSGTIQQWDPVTGKPEPSVFNFLEGTKIHEMKVSPDGNQIAVGTAGGTVQLWDRRTGTVGSVLEGHKNAVYFILYSPCGRWLLTCDEKNYALLWDLRDTQQQSPIRTEVVEKALEVYDAAFSSSGHRIAILYRHNSVRIIDLPSRRLVQSKKFEVGDSYSLAYSPNGQELAFGCRDGSIYLWNVDQSDDEECSAKLRGHQSWVLSVAYSSCGQWIAYGSGDQNVWLWRRSPEEPTSWSCVVTVRSLFDSVDQIVWSPVVPMEFVTLCSDKSVRIWRVSNDGGRVVVRMLWGSNLRMLYAEGLVLDNATGLSPINQSLLFQRGAVDSSVVHGKDESEP